MRFITAMFTMHLPDREAVHMLLVGANAMPQHTSDANSTSPLVIRYSFARQGLMSTLNASLTFVAPGEIHIDMPFAAHLTQQDGYIHGGVITSLADNACGYAALSLAPAGSNVLAVEFKVNLLTPARAPHFQARGRVLRRGRTLTV